MAQKTLSEIAHRVLGHCEMAGIDRATVFVLDTFEEVVAARLWSWLRRKGQFLVTVAYTTGTATILRGDNTVTLAGGATTSATMRGRQFKSGDSPIYTINDIVDTTHFTINELWGDDDLSAATYTIFDAYVTVPLDFLSFISVWDPDQAIDIDYLTEREDLDREDPQRTNTGNPTNLVPFVYSDTYAGAVETVVQAYGAGPSPESHGSYTGVDNAVFVIEVTKAGISGTAEFKWKKNGGSYTTGVVSSDIATEMQEGVALSWANDGSVFVLGNIFLVPAYVGRVPGRPQFEVWPHVLTNYCIPFMYRTVAPDLEAGDPMPMYVTPDLLLEGALAKLAAWPGEGEGKENPYYDLGLAKWHQARFSQKLDDRCRLDDETYTIDVTHYGNRYRRLVGGDTDWNQKHGPIP